MTSTGSVWKDQMRSSLPCRDFSEFKEALQQMRAIDDKIIYKLNTTIPTVSFAGEVSAQDKCKELHDQMKAVYQTRTKAIQHCIAETTAAIDDLRTQRAASPDDSGVTKQLRKEQNKLRMMQNELVVEDVVEERSRKVFKERCWQAYKPPNF